MACDATRPRIRPFLDDLLDEKDYQDIHAHLESCVPCRAYASSVGTLSYRLYELGQAPLPPDMVSAILYESKKAISESPVPAAVPSVSTTGEGFFISKKDLFWVGVVVLLALTTASFAVMIGFRKKEEQPLSVPAAPQTEAEPVPAHAE